MSLSTRKKYCYEYPRPAVTVDILIVTKSRKRRILLVRRKNQPFAGMWALPGGFVNMDEALDDAARRELYEETGIEAGELEQLHTFGDVARDPRGRTISVAYLAEVDARLLKPRAADDAAEVAWYNLTNLPPLAFDHATILALAQKWLRRRMR
jgi:8-oxo-dGTP diphosphatase